LNPASLPTATSIVLASTIDKKWVTQTTATIRPTKIIHFQQRHPVSTLESKNRWIEFSEKYNQLKDHAPNTYRNRPLVPTMQTTKFHLRKALIWFILLPETTKATSWGRVKTLAEHDKDINLPIRHTLSNCKE
jgi:hypothetical protein